MAFGGEVVGYFPQSGPDFISQLFDMGAVELALVDVVGGLGPREKGTASVEVPTCSAPNLTQSESRNSGDDDEGVQILVLDDPTTDVVDDHWLHPCECAPPLWGQNLPVTSQTYSAIPAGSQNIFRPPPFPIVTGQFSCGIAEELLQVILETEVQTVDMEDCQVQCAETQQCRYFLTAEALSSKQCRLYSNCQVLQREVGLTGTLYSFPKETEVCAVADPLLCWHASKRRARLYAFYSPYNPRLSDALLDEELCWQCDTMLFLGGVGVEECSPCPYLEVGPGGGDLRSRVDKVLRKSVFRTEYKQGSSLKVSCWDERYAPLTGPGTDAGAAADFALTCVSGKWLDPGGSPGSGSEQENLSDLMSPSLLCRLGKLPVQCLHPSRQQLLQGP